MIPVTKPFLPSQEKYLAYVSQIFERQWLTNDGPLVKELEKQLKLMLNTDQLLFVSNGTLALQVAIKALGLKGDIITTPFSYVATTSSIVWEGCRPVFVDVDPLTLNIDPNKIEEAITKDTSAILATHCFGNACDIDAIGEIAKKHNLKVIYDAAHCFGSSYKGKSIFEYGDISTSSLHATKLMHSVEGGLVFAKDKQLLEKLCFIRNFGHNGFGKFNGVGINAKNSEFHAAMGLCVLENVAEILQKRKEQSLFYNQELEGIPIDRPLIQEDCTYNYSYYPVLFKNEETTLKVIAALESNAIFPRRYFYPSLSKLDYVGQYSTECSDSCASRILCLPLYHDLSQEEQVLISKTIREVLNEQ